MIAFKLIVLHETEVQNTNSYSFKIWQIVCFLFNATANLPVYKKEGHV